MPRLFCIIIVISHIILHFLSLSEFLEMTD